MCPALVKFSYRPGLKSNPFSNVRLAGSWNANGAPASDWTTTPMHPGIDPDGCPSFEAEVAFDSAHAGTKFSWGVRLDGPAGTDLWGIASEVDDEASNARQLSFVLQSGSQTAFYYLTCCYRLGAIKLSGAGLRFSLWAPNAQAVDLALADPARGYIADSGDGALLHLPMTKDGQGIWSIGLADFASLAGAPYMFRVTRDDNSIVYRTDMFSRQQIGRGQIDPGGQPYAGPPEALDGPHSCSVVCDTDTVQSELFWRDEFDAAHPLPKRVQDLVIYELHVGALGFGKPDIGTLDDAIALLDHLTALGINAVEMMPISEFEDIANWGYGTAQFLAIDQAVGGTERLMAFVKACHQRGIVVILDVCYNHFDPDADRAEWAYDSTDPTRNIYFWYEGKPTDYPNPDGGYIDNISSGWAPRFDQEMVRQVFISSAAWFVDRCHVNGFRLDQTSSIHQYPAIHANGQQASRAAAFGTKFLKQWSRTMRLLNPGLFLSAEDYSDWDAMTQPCLNGDGLGFDVTWYGEFHHNLVEFKGGNYAELVKQSGYGDDRPLRMDYFAGAVRTSANAKVVYTESHDDCGNRDGSARTIVLAVNGAALTGDTRRWAEARQRFAAGMALLSAGTPMFFMGEEIGAQKPYTYDTFLDNREDILGDAVGTGASLFAYYKDLIRLSVHNSAIRSRNIEVALTDNDDRVIAFHRWDDSNEFLVVASLNDTAFSAGYWLYGDRIGDAGWTEIFNSDAQAYGGWNIGNAGQRLQAEWGLLNVIIPASGLVVFRRT